MEPPFSPSEVGDLRDAVEWAYAGVRFPAGELLPDGKNPAEIAAAWDPWIREIVLFMDGEGTVRHWKYGTAYAEEPYFDQMVYTDIRKIWIGKENERRNA